jgi:hypothetical protein
MTEQEREVLTQLGEVMDENTFRLVVLLDAAYNGEPLTCSVRAHESATDTLVIDVLNVGMDMCSRDLDVVVRTIWNLFELRIIEDESYNCDYRGLKNYCGGFWTLFDICLYVKYRPEALKDAVGMLSQ